MSDCQFDTCGKTTGDGMALCFDCTEGLEYDLAAITGVLEDLGAVVARKTKGAPSVGGGTNSNPLPVDLDAMAKGKDLMRLLTSWYQLILEPLAEAWNAECDRLDRLPTKGRPDYPICPHIVDQRPDADTLTNWLLSHIDQIRKQDWAPDMKREVGEALLTCRRATDRADERIFAGMCPTDDCGAPVYTKAGKPIARCQVCTTQWDVAEWRGRALDYARFESGTAAQLSRMLTDPVTGESLPVGTIRSWASREKLTPSGRDANGKPVYCLDDVRKVWADMKASAYGNPNLKVVC